MVRCSRVCVCYRRCDICGLWWWRTPFHNRRRPHARTSATWHLLLVLLLLVLTGPLSGCTHVRWYICSASRQRSPRSNSAWPGVRGFTFQIERLYSLAVLGAHLDGPASQFIYTKNKWATVGWRNKKTTQQNTTLGALLCRICAVTAYTTHGA